ncbi:MAG: HNH endonuclease [Verrucomicrobiia bacterium]
MDVALESFVRTRANGRCEYRHFPEACAELPFQLDHIIARQHRGTAAADNLALACCFCSRYKGPNLSGFDPETEYVVRVSILENRSGWITSCGMAL